MRERAPQNSEAVYQYRASATGLNLTESITYSPPNPEISLVELISPNENTLSITFRLPGIVSRDQGLAVIQPLLERIPLDLTYEMDVAIEDPRLESVSIPPIRTATGQIVEMSVAEEVSVADSVGVMIAPSHSKRDTIARRLASPSALDSSRGRAYREALLEDNPTVRFAMLYRLLLTIHGDCQQAVDAAILRVDPNTETTPSPRGGRSETVYTRLRNELSHDRSTSAPEMRVTLNDIAQRVDGLRRITKQMI